MGSFIDSTIGLLIVAIFGWVILRRVMVKFPKSKESIGEYLPWLKNDEKTNTAPVPDHTKQVWEEKRTIL